MYYVSRGSIKSNAVLNKLSLIEYWISMVLEMNCSIFDLVCKLLFQNV